MKRSSCKDENVVPGVFCSIEGCLIKDGVFFEEMYWVISDLSMVKEVTLFSDNITDELKDFCTKKGITWDIISLTDFSGLRLEVVFTGDGYHTFNKKYGVTAKHFRQI